jgi:hypothetical protein
MTYATIVARSAELYASHLERQLEAPVTGPGRALLEAALTVTRHGAAPGVLDVHTVSAADVPSRKAAINPYGLGLGNPDADVLVVGREAAFDLQADHLNLLLESIGLTALWQSRDRSATTATLAPQVGDVDFPREAWRAWKAYRPHRTAPHPGQTWSKVGRLLGYARIAGQVPDWQGWTNHAYLTDIGAPPSPMYAGGGKDPVRHAFLAELAVNFAKRGTRTLLHMSRSPVHRAGQEAMARAFLDVSTLPPARPHALGPAAADHVERVVANGKVVMWTRHLSGSVPNCYLEKLRGLLKPDWMETR